MAALAEFYGNDPVLEKSTKIVGVFPYNIASEKLICTAVINHLFNRCTITGWSISIKTLDKIRRCGLEVVKDKIIGVPTKSKVFVTTGNNDLSFLPKVMAEQLMIHGFWKNLTDFDLAAQFNYAATNYVIT